MTTAANVSIPFLDLASPHRQLEEEFIATLRAALRSATFIGGAEVEGFEREFGSSARQNTASVSATAPMPSAFP